MKSLFSLWKLKIMRPWKKFGNGHPTASILQMRTAEAGDLPKSAWLVSGKARPGSWSPASRTSLGATSWLHDKELLEGVDMASLGSLSFVSLPSLLPMQARERHPAQCVTVLVDDGFLSRGFSWSQQVIAIFNGQSFVEAANVRIGRSFWNSPHWSLELLLALHSLPVPGEDSLGSNPLIF